MSEGSSDRHRRVRFRKRVADADQPLTRDALLGSLGQGSGLMALQQPKPATIGVEQRLTRGCREVRAGAALVKEVACPEGALPPRPILRGPVLQSEGDPRAPVRL